MLWVNDSVRMIALGLLSLLAFYALVQYAGARRRGTGTAGGSSLRRSVVTGLIATGTLPAVSLGLLLIERSVQLREEQTSKQLVTAADAMSREVEQFMDKHLAGVLSAAGAINTTGRFDSASLARWLEIFHRTYPDFLTMLATDAHGNIVAATSLSDGVPVPVSDLAGQNVSDRGYYRVPMANGRPYISKVFQGRGLGNDPIVAVSAPLLDPGGQRRGIVEGSLNLRAFSRLETGRMPVSGSAVIVLDPEVRVIYASDGTGLETLKPLTGVNGYSPALAASDGAISRFDAEDKGSVNVIGVRKRTSDGWAVLVQAPLRQIKSQVAGDYRVGLLLLTLAIAMSLLLSAAIMRRFSQSLEALNQTVRRFSLDGKDEAIVIPENAPAEFQTVFRQMRKRSKQLIRTHQRLTRSIEAGTRLQSELNQSIVNRETEIELRTAELAEANRQLEELARHDALTGISNRRAFEESMPVVWRQCARQSEALSVVMVDIDYFKRFNDSLGHQAGDDCIRQVAQALKACASRPLDVVARYGGEEFVLVLASTPLENALIVAERMVVAVTALAIEHKESPHGIVSVSVGVAASRPLPGETPDLVMQQADAALYHAKSAGRNCIAFESAAGLKLHTVQAIAVSDDVDQRACR